MRIAIGISVITLLAALGCASRAGLSAMGAANLDDETAPTASAGMNNGAQNCTVQLEIDPVEGSGFMPQQLPNVTLTSGWPTQIQLQQKVTMRGQIHGNNRTTKNTTSSIIGFNDISDTPIDMIAIPVAAPDTAVSAEPTSGARRKITNTVVDSDGGFHLDLLANQNYRIIFNPQGLRNQPPFFFSANLAKDSELDIVMSSDSPLVSGKITLPQTNAKSTPDMFKARVFQGIRLVSSASQVALDGTFIIPLAWPLYNEKSKEPLRLEIGPLDSNTLLPTVSKNIGMAKNNQTIAVNTINLTNLNVIEGNQIFVFSKQGVPVKDVRILFDGKTADGKFTRQATTGENGLATLSLLEGTYNVTLIPPLTSSFESYEKQGWVVSTGMQKQITLWQKSKINATVLDFNRRAIEGAHVHFVPITTLVVENQHDDLSFDVTSNSDGFLCAQTGSDAKNPCPDVFLARGSYQVQVVPPPGSPLPIVSQAIDVAGDAQIDFVIPQGEKFLGQIVDSKSKSVISHALVRLFTPSNNEQGVGGKLLAESFTDNDGNFAVFIAPGS